MPPTGTPIGLLPTLTGWLSSSSTRYRVLQFLLQIGRYVKLLVLLYKAYSVLIHTSALAKHTRDFKHSSELSCSGPKRTQQRVM